MPNKALQLTQKALGGAMDNLEAEKLLAKWPGLMESFISESDRTIVILAGSLLDDLLTRLLKAFFVECNQAKDLLVGGMAPLGTFSARIKASYTLGLITKNEYLDLNKIRKIRNDFAHNWDDIDLNLETVVGKCTTLSIIRTNVHADKLKPRSCLLAAVGVLFISLGRKALKVERRKECKDQS